MTNQKKVFFLQWALKIGGIFLILGIAPLMHFWPSGWRWMPHNLEYEQMIAVIYATLSVFLIRAAKNPEANKSLIWFFIWSSITHATVMLYQAIHTHQYTHIWADVLGLYVFAAVFSYLMPKKSG